jgi:tetratricopeptide (TPR) repeat protein
LKEADSKAMTFFYNNKDSAAYYLHRCISIAKNENDTIQAKIFNKIGVLFNMNAQRDSASFYFEKALKKASPKYKSTVLINVGILNKKNSNYDKAIIILNEALAISLAQNDEKSKGIIYAEMGSTYILKLERTKGIECLIKGIAIMKKLGIAKNQAITEQNLAAAYFDSHNYAFAKEIYESCLPFLKASGDVINYTIALGNYGDCLYYLKSYKKSEAILREANSNLNESLDFQMKAQFMGKLARVIVKYNPKSAEANACFKKAFAFALQSKSTQTVFLANDYLHYLNAFGLHDQVIAADIQYRKAVSLSNCSVIGRTPYLEEVSKAQLKLGNKDAALDILQKVVVLKDSVKTVENDQQLQELEAKYQNGHLQKSSQKTKDINLSLSRKLYLGLLLFFFICIGFGYYFWISKKQKNQSNATLTRIEKENVGKDLALQEALEENTTKEDIIQKQLVSLMASSMEQLNLKEQLLQVYKDLKDNNQTELATKLEGVDNQKHWEQFMTKFNALNPNFINTLSQKYPSLNSSELNYCALLRLNLSLKEIANVLQIKHDSVFTKNYRIKKKMNLTDDADFIKVIQTL